jgi:hypothetical protein
MADSRRVTFGAGLRERQGGGQTGSDEEDSGATAGGTVPMGE